MSIATLPISGEIPTSITFEQSIDYDEEFADLMRAIRGNEKITRSVFPPTKVEFDIPACSARENEESITLKEFYQRVSFMPPDSQIAIVIHNIQYDNYRLHNTEVVTLLDYDWDKDILTFWSVDRSKGKLIEYAQIANAVFEDRDGQLSMVRRYHNQLMQINGNTPIFLNTTYGKRKVDNVITFVGHTAWSDKPHKYIGLVIDEYF